VTLTNLQTPRAFRLREFFWHRCTQIGFSVILTYHGAGRIVISQHSACAEQSRCACSMDGFSVEPWSLRDAVMSTRTRNPAKTGFSRSASAGVLRDASREICTPSSQYAQHIKNRPVFYPGRSVACLCVEERLIFIIRGPGVRFCVQLVRTHAFFQIPSVSDSSPSEPI